jgi:NAD(P)H-dependent FMN reductase
MMAAPRVPHAYPDFVNVLVLVGLPAGPVNRALSRLAIDSSPNGVVVNVFNDLMGLPRYNEALENRGTPDTVLALRAAATEADAVLVVTSYRGRVPSVANSAIDWLTRRWRHGALHDKPLAVVGRSTGCYSGVWSRQIEGAQCGLGARVIEPLEVPTLGDVIKKLADEVPGGSASCAPGGDRHITESPVADGPTRLTGMDRLVPFTAGNPLVSERDVGSLLNQVIPSLPAPSIPSM